MKQEKIPFYAKAILFTLGWSFIPIMMLAIMGMEWLGFAIINPFNWVMGLICSHV